METLLKKVDGYIMPSTVIDNMYDEDYDVPEEVEIYGDINSSFDRVISRLYNHNNSYSF